jgi:hypothetical protein
MRLRTLLPALTSLLVSGLVADAASAACTRLAFSVNDYGKDGPTKDAQRLLDTYVAKWTAERGIKKYTTGKKDVKCELFLDVGLFDEHTCRAEASVCWEGAMPAGVTATAPAGGTATKAASAPGAAPKAATAKPAAATAVKTGSIPAPAAKPPVTVPAAVVAPAVAAPALIAPAAAVVAPAVTAPVPVVAPVAPAPVVPAPVPAPAAVMPAAPPAPAVTEAPKPQ